MLEQYSVSDAGVAKTTQDRAPCAPNTNACAECSARSCLADSIPCAAAAVNTRTADQKAHFSKKLTPKKNELAKLICVAGQKLTSADHEVIMPSTVSWCPERGKVGLIAIADLAYAVSEKQVTTPRSWAAGAIRLHVRGGRPEQLLQGLGSYCIGAWKTTKHLSENATLHRHQWEKHCGAPHKITFVGEMWHSPQICSGPFPGRRLEFTKHCVVTKLLKTKRLHGTRPRRAFGLNSRTHYRTRCSRLLLPENVHASQ